MAIKLSSLLAAAALATMANADCTASGNSDTNSAIDCAYLNPCTVEANQVPTSPSGYTIECETMPCPANQDIMFDKNGGTDIGELLGASCDNTVEQCQAACESTGGCCGFNFVFNPGQYESTEVGRCVAKACDGSIVTSRYGMVYYQRDAGAVPTQSPTVSEWDDDFDDLAAAGAAIGGALIAVFIVIPLLVIACICICCYFMLKKNNTTTVVVAQGAPVQMQPQTQMQP